MAVCITVVCGMQGFGFGVALQTATSTDFAPMGEASWGGAASTNW